jgi:phage-related protein (TIGR01555 family)
MAVSRGRATIPPAPPPNGHGGANGRGAPAANGHILNGHDKPKRAGVIGSAQYLQAVERNARRLATAQSPYSPKALDKLHPPTVVRDAPVRTLAQDEAISDSMAWAMSDAMYSTFAEGTTFLGYSYLSTLAQRAEYRAIVETIAGEMTREWIDFESTGEDDKSDKIAVLRHAVNEQYKLRDLFRKAAIDDGNFGRGHVYVDIDGAGTDGDRETLKTTIGNGRDAASTSKVGKGTKLKFRTVEPIWCYPQNYNTTNPLSDEWYNPSTWVVMSHEVHKSRLLTMVGREVPDMLKPAYSFGGLALTQMVKPYVDNWLKTRQSVSDLVQAFSVLVLKTVMGTDLMEGSDPFSRADFFNLFRHNNGLLMIDRETEDLANVAAPLGTLDALQAQSQEHMAAVSRIPIVKLLGIQPAGLNASSEGEIRTFYDWIAAYQELLFREPLETCVNFIQLQLWGEIDPHINLKFETLWQLDEAGLAGVEQTKAATHQVYVDLGVVQAEDVRSAIQSDPNSLYNGVQLQPLPEPPSPQSMGLMGGMPGASPPGAPQAPGGPSQAPGAAPATPRAAAPRPKAPSFKPPPSPTHGTQPSVNVAKPGNTGRDRALHPPPYRLHANDIALDTYDPNEKRDDSGKWTEGGSGGGSPGGSAEPERAAQSEPDPDTGAGAGGGRERGGSRSLEQASRSATHAAAGQPGLAGLPTKPIKVGDDDYYVPGPIAKVRDAAWDYMKSAGLTYHPPHQYLKVDKERATRIADAFDQMKHDPDDPQVKASYEALAKETLAQWQAIKKTGLKVEWIKPGQADPYAKTPRLAAIDLTDHNHWWGFPTDMGFGSGEEAEAAKHNNPLLAETDEVIDGRKCVVNDIFRIVHDYFGHFKEGVGFRADGEENAWRSHAAMYSPLARGAMTSETRGQNSWVNFGPYGETNRTASGADTHYAPQKIGLLPAWVMEEGRRDPGMAQDAGWNPQAHPRGQPKNKGEFVKGSGHAGGGQAASAGGGQTPWIQQVAHGSPWIQQIAAQNAAPHPGVISRAAHSAVHGISHAAGEFSKEDYEVLHEHLLPNSPARQGYGRRILNIASTLPALLVNHFKEEYYKFKNAGGALKSLATGHRPSPEQWKGLRQAGLTVALAGAMFMLTGEPTGAAAHAAEHAAEAAVGPAIQHLATEFGGELVNHTIMEHVAKLAAGTARFVFTAATGASSGHEHAKDAMPNGVGFDPDEIQLLQQFIAELAHNAVTYPIDDRKLYASLPDAPPPSSPGGGAPQAQDAGWNEQQHHRGQPKNRGQFSKGGNSGQAKTSPKAPERRDTAPPKLSVGGNSYKAASHADPGGKVTTWAQSVPEAQVPAHEAQHAVSNMAQAQVPLPSANSASDLLRQNYKPVSVEGFLSKQPPAVLAKIRQVESRLMTTPKTSAPVSQGGYMRPDGTWTPERQALHAQIINKFLSPSVIARATPKPGTRPSFTMIGGRGGSGKSWFTKTGVVDPNVFVLDNDAIKQQLPEYQGWNAALLHEEASDLFDKIDARARALGLNVAHDATMRSIDHKKAAAYKAAGYDVHGLYMFVPPHVSAQRAINRFMGPEGRYVPPSYILGSTTNESSFDAMKPQFGNWQIFRNDVEGAEPTLVAQSANAPSLARRAPGA